MNMDMETAAQINQVQAAAEFPYSPHLPTDVGIALAQTKTAIQAKTTAAALAHAFSFPYPLLSPPPMSPMNYIGLAAQFNQIEAAAAAATVPYSPHLPMDIGIALAQTRAELQAKVAATAAALAHTATFTFPPPPTPPLSPMSLAQLSQYSSLTSFVPQQSQFHFNQILPGHTGQFWDPFVRPHSAILALPGAPK